jgi:hypothetical protein
MVNIYTKVIHGDVEKNLCKEFALGILKILNEYVLIHPMRKGGGIERTERKERREG